MESISGNQVLTIVSWFLITTLLVIMLLIARLYKKIAGRPTYFWLFVAPIVLFAIATARYAFVDQIGGDLLADLVAGIGGFVLIALCVYLYTIMTAKR